MPQSPALAALVLNVSLYNSARDAVPKPLEVSWPELAKHLTSFRAGAKDGPAWSPALLEGTRANRNVKELCAVPLDLDHVPPAVLYGALALLEDRGTACAAHSTHSHLLGGPEDGCYRLVLPLSRSVTPEEWQKIRSAAIAALGVPVDAQCKDVSRLYYLPTAREGAERFAWVGPGQPVDVDEALSVAAATPSPALLLPPREPGDARPPAEGASSASTGGPDDLRACLKKALQDKTNDEPDKAEILRRVLAGQALAWPGDWSARGMDPPPPGTPVGRDAAILRACGLLAYWLPAGTSWETALEVLLPSLRATDCSPEGLEHWIRKAQEKYERAVWAKEAADATSAAVKAALEQSTPADNHTRVVVGPDQDRVADECVGALAKTPNVFQRSGHLAEIVVKRTNPHRVMRAFSVRLQEMGDARLQYLLNKVAAFVSGGAEPRRLNLPRWLVQMVMGIGDWPGIQEIAGVATAPTLREDGSLLSKPGYDPATELFLAPTVEVRVPEHPTVDDAREALAALKDVVCDFPFATAAGRSAWLAGLLSVAARPAIDGPCPLFLVDATVRGSGKTLLVDVASAILTGAPAARTTYSNDEDEMRKLITSIAIEGDQMVLLDNCTRDIGCQPLDEALTGTSWQDRLLGHSKMARDLQLRTVWWATANNAGVKADLSRRTLLTRLEPEDERPEERTSWKYPKLVRHVRNKRADLLSAALTAMRAYLVAGCPETGARSMGSYESWSETVGAALAWAGEPDPWDTLQEIRAKDDEHNALSAAVHAWPLEEGQAATARELLECAQITGGESIPKERRATWRDALLEWCPAPVGESLPSSSALGQELKKVKGRVIGEYKLESTGTGKRSSRWMRVPVKRRP